jgi:SAM-dependent methyltransferase
MSDETSRDSAPSVPPGERDDALPGASRLTPPPTVPRPRPSGAAPPSRKPTFPGASVAPPSAPIPPPAPMPRVPGMDAFMAAPPPPAAPSGPNSPITMVSPSTPIAPPSARASQRPSVPGLDDTDVGWATPGPPPAIPAFLDDPNAPPSSPSSDPIAAARRKSRRTVKIPDDSVPMKSAVPAASADRISAVPHLDAPPPPPPARAQASSAPWLDGFPTEAATPVAPPAAPPVPRPAPPIEAAAPVAPIAAIDTSSDVIQPMRIISIGSDSLPPMMEAAPASVPSVIPIPNAVAVHLPVAAAPSAPADPAVEEVEALEDDEPDTQPSSAILARAQAESRPEEIEAIEEIELERISDVASSSLEAAAPGPKKPPPPPLKRGNSIEPGPTSAHATPPPPAIAAFTAAAPLASPPPAPATPPPASAPSAAAAAAPVAGPPAETPRKRQKPWWEELFGDDYLRTMDRVEPKHVRRECDFIEDRLGLEKGAVMLDLACGPGAHAVELASRGYSVVGYDLSLAMLARAADEAQERSQKLNFLQGDMREMAFEDTFDGVYCWQTSFGYFDDEKNVNVLQRIHRALRAGGMLLLDVINHDYVAPRQPSLVWFEGDGCVCMDEMAVDFFTSRLRVKRTVMFEDGRAREVDYNIRLYALHELGKMLHECGFKVIEVTGHPAHPGVFFGSESPRLIVLAERTERT